MDLAAIERDARRKEQAAAEVAVASKPPEPFAVNLPPGTRVKLSEPPAQVQPKAEEHKQEEQDEEEPPRASLSVVTGAATAMERLFVSEPFPQSTRGFGQRTVAPGNRGISVVLPPGSRHWHEQRVQWERVQQRERCGKPPKLKQHALQGVSIPQACQDQMLRMQANLFELMEENRSLATTVSRLQKEREALHEDLHLAASQGFDVDAAAFDRECRAAQHRARQNPTRDDYDDGAVDVSSRNRARPGSMGSHAAGRASVSIHRRHRELAEAVREKQRAEANRADEAARLAAMPPIGPPGTATGTSGAFVAVEGLDASLATPRHQSLRVAQSEELSALTASFASSDASRATGADVTLPLDGTASAASAAAPDSPPAAPATRLVFAPAPPTPLFNGYVPPTTPLPASYGSDVMACGASTAPTRLPPSVASYAEPWQSEDESSGAVLGGSGAATAHQHLTASPPTSRDHHTPRAPATPLSTTRGTARHRTHTPAASSPRPPPQSYSKPASARASRPIGTPDRRPGSAHVRAPSAYTSAPTQRPPLGADCQEDVDVQVPYRVVSPERRGRISIAKGSPKTPAVMPPSSHHPGCGMGPTLLASTASSIDPAPRKPAPWEETSVNGAGGGAGGPTVVALPLGTWYADGGAAVAQGLGLQATLDLTCTCWGQMKRALDAKVFCDMVSARLTKAGLLSTADGGDVARAAVQLSFPEGIPRRRERPLDAPQLVVGVAVRLMETLLKDHKLLMTLRTHAEVVARSLGEATGVDSVTCRLSTRPEDDPHWRPDEQPQTAELMSQGEKRYVVYQRGIEMDPYKAVKSDYLTG